MTRKEKREERVRANRVNVALDDFESLINQYGYIKEGGRHPLAVVGGRVFPYKRTNPVNKPYVDKLIEVIDSVNKK